MPFYRDDELEAFAREARIELNIDNADFQDLMTLIVKMKQLGWIKNYERVPDHRMPNIEAEFNPRTRILRIRESVFCAANSGDKRAMMTVAHEIGHIYLGHKETRHRSIDDSGVVSVSEKRDESQAKRFGAAFRAPAHRASPHITEAEIATKFGLTDQAAKIRRQQFDLIFRGTPGFSRPVPKAVTDFLDTPRQYELTPCKKCGHRKVLRAGDTLRCDRCGHKQK